MLITDLSRMYRYTTGTRLRRIFACYMMPGVQAVKTYRFGHWLLTQPFIVKVLLQPLYFSLYYRCWRKWGIDISYRATIGTGILIFHFGGIFIGEATIGRNCTIRHDTTIGETARGPKRGAPVMGDNVDIAPGVVITGRLTIGDNVRIGPNAVIQRDIPGNCVVNVRPVQIVAFPNRYEPTVRGDGKVLD
jgi:serine O-acetyltransferase